MPSQTVFKEPAVQRVNNADSNGAPLLAAALSSTDVGKPPAHNTYKQQKLTTSNFENQVTL